jgi:hypothetical protein
MSVTIDPHAPEDGAPTTTHAEWGAGNPRLVFNVGEDWDGSPAREFLLVETDTAIGSSESSTLQLAGLDPEHARIVHEDDDEYVLYVVGDAVLGAAEAAADTAPQRQVLRTGAKVQLGSWSMFFTRDESADHGRPFGGRVGGELAHQKPQPERPNYTGE